MAYIEQKGWNYLVRVKKKLGILSGLRLPDTPEFEAAFSCFLSKRLTNRIRRSRRNIVGSPIRFILTTSAMQVIWLHPVSFRMVSTNALPCEKASIHYAGYLRQNDALQFGVPASPACQFYAAEGRISLPCERCFCRPHCTGVPAWFCVYDKSRIAHYKFSASCPA